MSTNPLQAMLDFLVALDNAKIFYRLSRPRAEALMVEAAVPGERWEVEFFADGHIETERFRTMGEVTSDPALLQELLSPGV
jgi:hypothetical protein